MKPSLSVILPVHNAQESLTRIALRLLETLPDLTANFEILVVDDGSTDHTAEIAEELRRQFPQVRVVHHGWEWGVPAAVRTGRAHCRGEIVLVVDSPGSVNSQELLRQWKRSLMGPAECSRAEPLQSLPHHPPVQSMRTDCGNPPFRAPRPPTFLGHLRRLAIGS